MTRITNGIGTPYGVLSRELTEFVRETRPELLCPQHRSPRNRGRIATVLAALAGAAAITLLASAHAFADPAQASRLTREHHACALVLGLDPSEEPYQDCIATLDRNLPRTPQMVVSVNLADGTTHQKASAACADIGLARDSLAYGRCVVDLDQTLSDDQQIYR